MYPEGKGVIEGVGKENSLPSFIKLGVLVFILFKIEWVSGGGGEFLVGKSATLETGRQRRIAKNNRDTYSEIHCQLAYGQWVSIMVGHPKKGKTHNSSASQPLWCPAQFG